MSNHSRSDVMRWGERILLTIASLTIVFMMLMTGVDVIGRYLFNAPVVGTFELTKFAMGIAVFSALPVVALRNTHVVADILSASAPPVVRKILHVVSDVCGLVVFSLLAWRLWREGAQFLDYGTTAGVLRLPLAHLAFYAAILSGFTAIIYLLVLITRQRPNEEPAQ